MTLARVRREYRGDALLESRTPGSPLPLLLRWLREALRQGFLEPNAMTLATVDARPDAALVLWWPELHRQVRVEGRVAHVSVAESDAYFATRPRGAQLGAWASPQSRVVRSRAVLNRSLATAGERFRGREVPRPPHWGGFRLVPRAIEFWRGRPDRMHDRLRYTRAGGRWRRVRLAP